MMKPVTINGFSPELLVEALADGVAVIPNPLDEAVLDRLQLRADKLSWEVPEYGESVGWHRSQEVVVDSFASALRYKTWPIERAVLQGLRQATQLNASVIGESALLGWGEDTFGFRHKLAKRGLERLSTNAKSRLPALPESMLDRYLLTMRYHRLEPGGYISTHTDSEDLQGVEYVLVVDQDDAAADFVVKDRKLPVNVGDIVILPEAIDPTSRDKSWPGEFPRHSLRNGAEADRDRITAIFGYERVGKYLLKAAGQ